MFLSPQNASLLDDCQNSRDLHFKKNSLRLLYNGTNTQPNSIYTNSFSIYFDQWRCVVDAVLFHFSIHSSLLLLIYLIAMYWIKLFTLHFTLVKKKNYLKKKISETKKVSFNKKKSYLVTTLVIWIFANTHTQEVNIPSLSSGLSFFMYSFNGNG